jgi:arginase
VGRGNYLVTDQLIATSHVDAPEQAQESQNRLLTNPIRPIVAPLWLGAERRGVEQGAPALETGLRTRWERRQDVERARRALESITIPTPEPTTADDLLDRRSFIFLDDIAVSCQGIADEVSAAIERGELALVLGGDHALAVGSIAGASQSTGQLGLLWFDSHADMNTPETSPSGHIHGMSLAAALGDGPEALTHLAGPVPAVSDGSICLLGVRDLDPGERSVIAERGIWILTMEEWHDIGIGAGVARALAHLTSQGVSAVHVSFDLDVLDPLVLPGTGTPVVGGLSYREASEALRRLRDWNGPIHSVDWVELNPALDQTGQSTEIAISLLSTLLGESMR